MSHWSNHAHSLSRRRWEKREAEQAAQYLSELDPALGLEKGLVQSWASPGLAGTFNPCDAVLAPTELRTALAGREGTSTVRRAADRLRAGAVASALASSPFTWEAWSRAQDLNHLGCDWSYFLARIKAELLQQPSNLDAFAGCLKDELLRALHDWIGRPEIVEAGLTAAAVDWQKSKDPFKSHRGGLFAAPDEGIYSGMLLLHHLALDQWIEVLERCPLSEMVSECVQATQHSKLPLLESLMNAEPVFNPDRSFTGKVAAVFLARSAFGAFEGAVFSLETLVRSSVSKEEKIGHEEELSEFLATTGSQWIGLVIDRIMTRPDGAEILTGLMLERMKQSRRAGLHNATRNTHARLTRLMTDGVASYQPFSAEEMTDQLSTHPAFRGTDCLSRARLLTEISSGRLSGDLADASDAKAIWNWLVGQLFLEEYVGVLDPAHASWELLSTVSKLLASQPDPRLAIETTFSANSHRFEQLRYCRSKPSSPTAALLLLLASFHLGVHLPARGPRGMKRNDRRSYWRYLTSILAFLRRQNALIPATYQKDLDVGCLGALPTILPNGTRQFSKADRALVAETLQVVFGEPDLLARIGRRWLELGWGTERVRNAFQCAELDFDSICLELSRYHRAWHIPRRWIDDTAQLMRNLDDASDHPAR